MIDETEEGIKTAKQNEIAKDGKVIYKPMIIKLIQPIKVIHKPIKASILKPMTVKLIKPSQKKIIYPIAAKPKKARQLEKEYFLPKQQLEDIDNALIPKIKVDTSFQGMNKSSKRKTITPINIE